jgi:hypothetical protein
MTHRAALLDVLFQMEAAGAMLYNNTDVPHIHDHEGQGTFGGPVLMTGMHRSRQVLRLFGHREVRYELAPAVAPVGL